MPLQEWERQQLTQMFVENKLHPLVTLQSLIKRMLELDAEVHLA